MRFIIAALELNPITEVCYVAPTGKASEVLRKSGCPNARTVHKLLYRANQQPNGKYVYSPRKRLEGNFKLIVVDEVSMLPQHMWELLLSHRIYVLALGDPFQLPAIFTGTTVLDQPHIFLDEIMRQAKESDIIQMSMRIREQKQLVPYLGNDINIFQQKELCTGMYDWADQIICATNETRFRINDYKRGTTDPKPQIGDKIICLQNSWDIFSDKHNPIVNGTIGYIEDMYLDKAKYHIKFVRKKINEWYKVPILYTTFRTDDGEIYRDIPFDYTSITTNKKFFTPQQEYGVRYTKKHVDEFDDTIPEMLPLECNYAGGITCHRAQGSQWEKVLVLEENFPFSKQEHARWLYTAITRAQKKCTLVLKN